MILFHFDYGVRREPQTKQSCVLCISTHSTMMENAYSTANGRMKMTDWIENYYNNNNFSCIMTQKHINIRRICDVDSFRYTRVSPIGDGPSHCGNGNFE